MRKYVAASLFILSVQFFLMGITGLPFATGLLMLAIGMARR